MNITQHTSTSSTRLALLSTLTLSLLIACGGDDAQTGKEWETKEEQDQSSVDMTQDSTDMDSVDSDQGDLFADMNAVTPQPAPPYPAAVETSAPTLTLQSGEQIEITCTLLDQYGEPIQDEAVLEDAALNSQATPEDVLHKYVTGEFEARQVGEARVGCRSRKLGLVDTTPEVITVIPGDAYRTVATVSERSITAGSSVDVTCRVYDMYGNLLPDADTTVTTDIMGDGILIEDHTISATRADQYSITCLSDAAPETVSASLEVVPSLPASLVIEKEPFQDVYGLGQVITIATRVTDMYNNVIPSAPVEYTSTPDGESFGLGRFRYFEEGTYNVLARVTGPTQDDIELSASTEILVNGVGPEIQCDSPIDGAQLLATPGGVVKFQGTLADVNGIQFVFVNGAPATLNPDGTFEADITTRYGINFVDITARDDFNVENSRTCAFQLSDNWTAPGSIASDAVMLKLRQPAIDDNARSGPISSLGDILHTILNSTGLTDTIDSAFRAMGPSGGGETKIYDDDCATRIIFCIRARVWYKHNSFKVNGNSTVNMDLIQDGLNLKTRINDIKVKVRVKAAGIIDTTGTVTIQYVDVDVDSNLQHQNNKPRITLRRVNSTSVGNVSTDFNGIDGWIVNLLVGLFQGTIGDMLKSQLESFINNEFNDTLDGLVNSLDVNSLGDTINIPKLDGTGDIPLNLNLDFSSTSATDARALFGLGLGFDGPVTKGINSRGAAIPAGALTIDPPTTKSAAVGVHITVVNQALHALWRGGFFDGTIGESTLGESVPEGTQVTLSTELPPMLILKGGPKADLHIGSMGLSVVYPGVFDEPIHVVLGATAKTSVQIVGENLEFTDIRLDEFYFSAPGISLDETTRDVLETFLKNLVQKIVDSSLNDALPALPIPSFTLPQDLSTYNLSGELKLYNLALDPTERHFRLDGDFGIR